jgi:hypothetical protein
MDEHQLVEALRAIAPSAPEPSLERLAALLSRLTQGRGAPGPVAHDGGPELGPLLAALAGREIRADNRLLSFGDQSQVGDVAVRDLAGGNIYHITFNVGDAPQAQGQPGEPAGHVDPEEAARKWELIAQHRKVLHQLELQAAQFGIYCPPHITIEIDERKRAIARLQRELGQP